MVGVEVVGLDKLLARLTRLTRALDPEITKVLKEIAVLMRDEAKRIVPVDTGSLQSSIRTRSWAGMKGYTQWVGFSSGGYVTNPKPGQIVRYMKFVEHGTSRQKAQPYMYPSYDMYKRDIPKRIKNALKE